MKALSLTRSFFIVTLLGLASICEAQTSAADIKKMVESQQFTFKAQSAMPARGGFRQLTTEYDLTVTKNSVVAYLPFFGQAQMAPVNPRQGGIKFSSSDFNYTVTNRKKGSRITIKLNDVPGVQQLYITIFDDGYANLDIVNINRDNISFRGYIQ